MTKKYYPVNLFFEAEVEYSKDNGTTWLTLAANTELEIDPLDLPSNGRVKVRSTNVITSLDRTKLGFNSREFESINIKNGKSLTTLENTFYGSFINNLRVANIPNVLTIRQMCRSSYINNLKISESSGVTDMEFAFYSSFIRAHSGIIAPSATKSKDMMSYMKNNNIMGDILLGSSGVLIDSSNLFKNSKIALFPNLEIKGAMHTGIGSGNYLFYELNSKYMLHNKIGSLLHRDRFIGIFSSSKLQFSGAEIYGSDLQSGFNSTSLEYPFSKLVKPNNKIDEINAWSTLSKSHLTQEQIDLLNTNGRPVIVELPDWIPNVKSLEQYDINQKVELCDSIGAVGMYYRMIKNNLLYISKYISTIADIQWEKPIANPYPTSNVDFARNGFYGYIDGADYKIFNESDVLAQTLGGITPKSVQFNSDASKVIVVTGASIDALTLTDQNVTNVVTVYNVNDASVDRVFNPVTVANEEIIGAYFPNDNSNIQIVRTNWAKAESFHNYLSAISSSIDSHNSITNDMVENVSLIGSGNIVVNNYGEDNEFGILDVSNGKFTRCFGK